MLIFRQTLPLSSQVYFINLLIHQFWDDEDGDDDDDDLSSSHQ